MIIIGKVEKDYHSCLSCNTTEDVNKITIVLDETSCSNSIRLCNKCIGQIVDIKAKQAIEEMENVKR